ncbi:MAG: Acetate operon repressor [Verrucomicrobiota bacterium]
MSNKMQSRSNPKTSPLNRYRVPILDRSLDLLELLVQHRGGLSLTALTEQLRMPKNSVYRIATTLSLRGYLERDEEARTYAASRKLLALGHAALGVDHLLERAWPVLTALRDATGETALIGTLMGHRGVVLDQAPSTHAVKVVVEIGHAFPLHTSAPGKAMLAFTEPEMQQRILAQMTFEKFTSRTITSKSAFAKELVKVQHDGFAVDAHEESASYACVGAPVFDHRNVPVAAIWISGPSDRMKAAQLRALGSTVQKHARLLSAKLGHGHS